MILSFILGVIVGALLVLLFYSRLFRKLEPTIHQLGQQRDNARWERDAAMVLYKAEQERHLEPSAEEICAPGVGFTVPRNEV